MLPAVGKEPCHYPAASSGIALALSADCLNPRSPFWPWSLGIPTVVVWIDHVADAALQGKLGTEVKLEEYGFVAWTIMIIHPLTWLIAYFFVEGAVRFSSAAFSSSPSGILPLVLVDGLFRKLLGVQDDSLGPRERKPAFSSVARSVKERILTATVPAGADELQFLRSGDQEILEIHASKRKED